MRAVFLGTPSFVVPVLMSLCDSRHEVVCVITQPDRPAGRGHIVVCPPVKRAAQERGLPILQPENANDPAVIDLLRQMKPDVMVLAAFGQFLHGKLLELAPQGCLNAHLSLLPRYRGAAPVAWAIMNGERVTGVSIIRLVKRMDAGPILCQETLEIARGETTLALEERMGRLAGSMAVSALDAVAAGEAVFRPQDESRATFAPALTKANGLIAWDRTAGEIQSLVRAMIPWPLAYTYCSVGSGHACVRIIVLKADVVDAGVSSEQPGAVIRCDGRGPVVATGRGLLRLLRVKPAGGKEMDGDAFVRGHRLTAGAAFGGPSDD
jgi:methionyl-tRNA formyltransferase